MADSHDTAYIHGADPNEQSRGAKLGELTDAAFLRFVSVRPTDRVLFRAGRLTPRRTIS